MLNIMIKELYTTTIDVHKIMKLRKIKPFKRSLAKKNTRGVVIWEISFQSTKLAGHIYIYMYTYIYIYMYI